MKLAETVTFGGSGLDRAAVQRRDAARLANSPAARVLPFWESRPLANRDADGLTLVPVQADMLAGAELIFLGVDETGPIFAADLRDWVPGTLPDATGPFIDPSRQPHPGAPDGAAFTELRSIMAALTPREAELAATSRSTPASTHAVTTLYVPSTSTSRHSRHCSAQAVIRIAAW